jgi:hypothetical protein
MHVGSLPFSYKQLFSSRMEKTARHNVEMEINALQLWKVQ